MTRGDELAAILSRLDALEENRRKDREEAIKLRTWLTAIGTIFGAIGVVLGMNPNLLKLLL